MTRASWINAAALVTALGLSIALAGAGGAARRSGPLVDATGHAIQDRAYGRIASASTVADRILIEVCDRRRVRAVTQASHDGSFAARYRGLASIASLDRVERLVALAPDLVIAHNVADARRVERLREAGLEVFDLGPLQGRASLPEDVRTIARLCGAEARGVAYAAELERALDAIAEDVPREGRPSAVYVSVYGDRLFGGTVGTSYHDVLVAAGLRDAAADRHRGWPQYTAEQLLELDPDRLVTRTDMGAVLCAQPALSRLRACPGGVIEIAPDLLDAPGPSMVDAARAIHRRVYPH